MGSVLGVDLVPFPGFCNPAKILITPQIATRIYRHLVAFAGAQPEQCKPFEHMVTDVSLGGLSRRQFIIRDGYYGLCGFYMCGDEWYCVTTLFDWSPKTIEALDVANLKLAELRDTIMAELFP
jgi:hypothetical protein